MKEKRAEKDTKVNREVKRTKKPKNKQFNATCALCGGLLKGFMGKTKSQKRVSRIFGGVLCNICSTTVIKEAAMVKEGIKKPGDLKLTLRRYVDLMVKKCEY